MEPPPPQPAPAAAPGPASEAENGALVVEAGGLEKSFGAVTAVRDTSFTIRRGECFGLLGPNGAGKSTCIHMIYGATSRSGGRLRVFGRDPACDARRIKEQLGVVTQENSLDEDMALRPNLLVYARCIGVPQAERAPRVDALLDLMALRHRADFRIRSLSGGMKRRLVFARALLGRPSMVVLDEPTTGLDPAVRLLLWEKVAELKRGGTTILLTTHYMDEAERLCDRLVIMDQGRTADHGSPRELIRRHCPGVVALYEPAPALRGQLRSRAEQSEDLHFSEDSSGLRLRAPRLARIEELLPGLDAEPAMIRPSNLEDVFLQLTGKELTADA